MNVFYFFSRMMINDKLGRFLKKYNRNINIDIN